MPIATVVGQALDGAKLLLMAQPLAQPAEDLVALDRWVRERRPPAAARRSDAGMGRQPAARRSDAAAADVHGHRAARPLGAAARRAGRARASGASSSAGGAVSDALARRASGGVPRSRGRRRCARCGSAKARRWSSPTPTSSTGRAVGEGRPDAARPCSPRSTNFEARLSRLTTYLSTGSEACIDAASALSRRRAKTADFREKAELPMKSHKIPLYPARSLSYQQGRSAGANPIDSEPLRRVREDALSATTPLARCERGVDVALEHLFQGSALNAVDAKGRVSIPAFLRSVIERRGEPHHRPRQAREFPLPQRLRPRLRRAEACQARTAARKGRDQPRRRSSNTSAQPDGLRRHRGSALRQLGPDPDAADDADARARSATSPCSSAPARRSRSGTRSFCSTTTASPRTSRTSPASGSKSGGSALTRRRPTSPVLIDEVVAAHGDSSRRHASSTAPSEPAATRAPCSRRARAR